MRPENIRILVVDDDAPLREVIAQRFRAFKFTVDTAHSGNSAFQLQSQNPYNIIITDIRMPDGDGMSLLNRVREVHIENPKVFVISGFSDYEFSDIFASGADGMFNKPFNTKLFMDTVRKALLSREDRWKSPPADAPVSNLEATFPTLEAAEAERKLVLGRGGFFYNLGEEMTSLAVDNHVEFSFEFDDGPISGLVGSGVVRWVRLSGNDRGIGVEFTSLQEGLRQETISLIDQRISSRDAGGLAVIPSGV